METGREGNGGREEERSGLVTMYAVNLAGCESSLQVIKIVKNPIKHKSLTPPPFAGPPPPGRA